VISPNPPTRIDALIIGAGPAGLFQVFQCGLQGMHVHVVDALPAAGGQCAQLYGDKPIYDIPGITVCTGHELTERLLTQIQPFAPTWHWRCSISVIESTGEDGWLVTAEQGQRWLTPAIFIAAGVGAFTPKKIKIEGLAGYEDQQVWYHQTGPSAQQNVVICGNDELAVSRAITLAQQRVALGHTHPEAPKSVTLLHRRDVFDVPVSMGECLAQLRHSQALEVVIGSMTGIQTHAQQHNNAVHLTALNITQPNGGDRSITVDTLEAYLGLSPRLGPIADWGLAMERKQIHVSPATMATSAEGIYAIGDINHYPGKRKLIVCAFHEATLAAFAAAEALAGQALITPYTTSSRLLQQRLGVSAELPNHPQSTS
jgi:thioredoxin reductase (NADPH)